ncbi:hypothetical protein [Comamonas sp. GB3 AK4-5]|uniref:DKNYY domain-containing protein n=1 Tax=Comamonas sp. GB3 AK4-5 TaxID=3231487 RepID=UPI00351E2BCF
MAWKRLAAFPEQKIIGNYQIEYWAIRDGKVWHQKRKLAAADPASFEVFEGLDFIARDVHSVFHAWSRLPKIDRDSFVQHGTYWRDRHNVYCEYETSLRPLANSDPASFRDLGGGYGADSQWAWYWGRHIKSCVHSQQLQVVADNPLYAYDGHQVYCDGKPLRGAHPGSWRPLPSGFSGDDHGIYYLERKLPRVDMASWRHLHGPWSKDRKQVFCMNRVEPSFHPDSFDQASAMARQAAAA